MPETSRPVYGAVRTDFARPLDGSSVDFSSPFYHVEVKQQRGGWLDVTSRVNSLIHNDSGKRSTSMLELELDNRDDYILAQYDLMRKGAIFRCRYGYPNLVRDAGEFVAKEHAGNRVSISVKSYERKRSRMARKMQARIWRNVTRSFVVRDVLRQQGFDNRQISITETKTKYPSISQTREDDWTFVQALAELQGFDFWADEGGVYWMRPQRDKKPTHLFRRVRNAIGIGFIKDYTIDSFGSGVPGRIVLKGRDPYLKISYSVTADNNSTEDLVLLTDSDDTPTPEEGDRAGSDNGYEMVRAIGMRSQKEAQRLADALYKEYKYNALKLKLTIFGDPTLRTHRNILVWGLGPALDGIYHTKTVRHQFSGGYNCELQLRRDGMRKKGRGGVKAYPEDGALAGIKHHKGRWRTYQGRKRSQ
jgi:phage protein D